MASDNVTDRDIATATTNYSLWKPKNQGPTDSWGVLLNENFDAIDLIIPAIYERITQVEIGSQLIGAALGSLTSRVDGIDQTITGMQTVINGINLSIDSINTELADARGSYVTLNDRLNRVVSQLGVVNLDVIFDFVNIVKWNEVNVPISGITSAALIADVFLANVPSTNGVSRGVRVLSGEADCKILASDMTPIYDAAGYVVSGKATKIGNDLSIDFIRQSTGAATSINNIGEPVYSSVNILYQEIVRVSNQDVVPKIVDAIKFSDLATDMKPGPVRLGSGHGLDADMVDGIHASVSPVANKLLPLDNSGQYAATVTRINNNGTLVTLQSLQPSFLRSDLSLGHTYKDITDYIGLAGARVFPLAKATDLGAQFTKTISNIEFMLDDHESRLDILEPAYAGTAIDLAVVSGEVAVLESWRTVHEPDPNAHHSSTSTGLDITPASVNTTRINAISGSLDHLDVNTLQVHVATYVQAEMVITDSFTDIGKASGDGPYGSEEIPLGTDYQDGFVFHKGMTYVSGEYGVLRYNATSEQIEFASNWTAAGGGQFVGLTGAPATAVVGPSGKAKYATVASAISALGGNGGKIILHTGIYAESFVLPGHMILEGMGYETFVSGDITLSGDFNALRDVRVVNTLIEAGTFNKIKDCFLVNDTVDNGTSTVLSDNILL